MSRVSSPNVALINRLKDAKNQSDTLTAFLYKAAGILAEAKKTPDTKALAEPLRRLVFDFGWSEKEPNYRVFDAVTNTLLADCLASLNKGEFPNGPLRNARVALDAFLEGTPAKSSTSHLPVLTRALLDVLPFG